jgi:hypothetical protein
MKESERQVGAKGKKHVFAAGRTHPDLRTAITAATALKQIPNKAHCAQSA